MQRRQAEYNLFLPRMNRVSPKGEHCSFLGIMGAFIYFLRLKIWILLLSMLDTNNPEYYYSFQSHQLKFENRAYCNMHIIYSLR